MKRHLYRKKVHRQDERVHKRRALCGNRFAKVPLTTYNLLAVTCKVCRRMM